MIGPRALRCGSGDDKSQMTKDKWKMMKFLTATAVSPKMSHV
jgi:hypothetical protein